MHPGITRECPLKMGDCYRWREFSEFMKAFPGIVSLQKGKLWNPDTIIILLAGIS